MTESSKWSAYMKKGFKRILPILLVIAVLCSVAWYLMIYDREFTRDLLLQNARYFENNGNHTVASWLYHQAYRHSGNSDQVAIELSEQYKSTGNYTKAEYTLSNAIADGGSVELYIALCKTYVEQGKILDAVRMLENVSDPQIKAQLDTLRPAAPTTNPEPGFYTQFIQVELSAAEGKLYASAENQYPSLETDVYTGPFSLDLGENTLYAVAVGENGLVSPRAIFAYTVGGVVEAVTLADSTLEAHLRQMLGFDEDHVLLTSDLWNVTELTVPSQVQEYSDLIYLTHLNKLTIHAGAFSDLLDLASLTELTELTITDCALSSMDLDTIANLPNLQKLTLSGCQLSSIQNLSKALGLTHLNLSENTIRDISALAFMNDLQELNLRSNAITSLSALNGLDELAVLNVSGNSLSSLESLAGCTGLKDLRAANNAIGLLTGVEELTLLEKLDVSHNTLTDVAPLAALTALTELNISHNTILDISALSELVAMEYFNFSYNEITELPALPKGCQLVTVDGSYNPLTTLAPLFGMQKLNNVIMDYTDISYIDGFATCSNMIKLSIYGTVVRDVSKLTELGIVVNYTPDVT
jgi:Leucine-rich repeat (LRR) protein